MALALILRNNCKSGARVLQHANFSPVKTYTAAITSQAVAKKLPFVKTLTPAARSISLTAPRFSAEGGNHATIWNIERGLILAMMGIIPAAFISPSQTMDSLLAVAIVIHQHWGLEAMVVDYIRPSVLGPLLPKVAHFSLYLFSVAVTGGLFYLIYNDIGIAESIKKLWSVKGAAKEE